MNPTVLIVLLALAALGGICFSRKWIRTIFWVLSIPPFLVGVLTLGAGGVRELFPPSDHWAFWSCAVAFLPAIGCVLGELVTCWRARANRTLKSLIRRLAVLFSVYALLVAFCAFYIKTHPLVFNESFYDHAHCIVIGGLSLSSYADEHGGRFPYSTNGYGDALLMIKDAWFPSLTGPGYDARVFENALRTGAHVPESDCGRVYVQGLSEGDDPEIALLFDKLPTPGGDHCHGIDRIFRPLAREVWTIGMGHAVIRESYWPTFARRQVELLVAAGISREQAEKYYAEKPKQ